MLLGLVAPYEGMVIPLYYDLKDLGLTDTYWALILPQIGLSVSFGTFWLRSFFLSTPRVARRRRAGRRRASWRRCGGCSSRRPCRR